MVMGIRMDEFAKNLLKSELTQQQREQAWQQQVIRKAKDFVAKYPKTPFAERFYVLLIDAALQQDNIPEAKATLAELRKNHPQSPYVEEIAKAIQQAAASQPSATQPAATQPRLPKRHRQRRRRHRAPNSRQPF